MNMSYSPQGQLIQPRLQMVALQHRSGNLHEPQIHENLGWSILQDGPQEDPYEWSYNL